MAWTQATRNGGNSEKTGNRNKNNNASANAQTANYGSGNSNASSSSSSSGDPRGNEGNNYTNYLTPAPKVPTPVYASPNEQGQQATPMPMVQTTPVYIGTTPVSNGTAAPAATITELPVEADNIQWLQKWAESLKTGVLDNNQEFQDQLDSSSQDVKDNLGLIEKNKGAIKTNRDATGNEIKGVQSNVDDTNKDLLIMEGLRKKLGLEVVDNEGQIVNVQRDLIDSGKQRISDQKADLLARNSQEAATNKALRQVDEQFANQYDTQSMFAEDTADAFKLSEEQILEVIQRQKENGVTLENVNSNAKKQIKDVEDQVEEKQKYNQEYWANRLKILTSQGEDAQAIISQEMDSLKDKTYSGDTIVTAEDQDAAWEELTNILGEFGKYETPATPKEYLYAELDKSLDEWVKSGVVTVERTTEGMLDEYTTSVYTMADGRVITRKSVSPVITDSDGEEYRFGNDTSTLYIDGVPVGQKDGELESLIPQGEANHIDSSVMIGEDTNPNSPANRPDGGNQNNNGGQSQGQGNQSEAPVAPSDPVVGEDIPLPDNLTDPDGTGAYGQNGQAFSLDGVTFWRRIKDRNGRWTYARLDSYQDNGTASRRAGLSNNVQNF